MTRRTVTGTLLAGVARAPHRVTAGMPIGPWGARATQTSTGVHKPLTVTALVLGQLDTGPAAVVIAIDTVSWPTDLGAAVAEAVGAALGVDPSAVFLAASHTHSGLSLDETYLAPWDPDRSARERRAELMAEIPGIAVAAASACRPVRAIATRVPCAIARSRRQQAFGRRLVGVSDVPSDETLDVVDLLAEDGSSLATVVAFGCHPTVLAWGNFLVSPDYIAELREVVERETGAPALFLQGCGADRAPAAGFSNQVADADAVGRAVGHAAVAALLESRQALLEIEPVEVRESGAALCITRSFLPQRPDVDVSVRVSELDLPLRPLDPAAARDRAEQARERVSAGDQSASVDLQRALIEQDLAERFPAGDTGRARPVVIRLGEELALVGWPGELSGAYDHAFQAAAQPVHVITATNVCDSVGYLPAYEQFAEGGYEVDASPFLPDASARAIDGVARLVLSPSVHDERELP